MRVNKVNGTDACYAQHLPGMFVLRSSVPRAVRKKKRAVRGLLIKLAHVYVARNASMYPAVNPCVCLGQRDGSVPVRSRMVGPFTLLADFAANGSRSHVFEQRCPLSV